MDPARVQARWREHLDGRDRSGELWAVLMVQAWLDAERSAERVPFTAGSAAVATAALPARHMPALHMTNGGAYG